MAPAPILSLNDVTLSVSTEPLLRGVSLALGRGDRIALVGRNGSGKSTLMKLIAGQLAPDAGERSVRPGTRIGFLHQEPIFAPGSTVAQHAAGEGAPEHVVAAILDRIGLEPDRPTATLSGGEARRADLARVLALDPELMLLDEPTNHLDMPTIEWLEGLLRGFGGAIVVVSHDRAFLAAVSTGVYWLDRGTLRTSTWGFARFDEWMDAVIQEEERLAQRLDTKLRAEAHWLVHGVSGRRKRNMRRVHEIANLRAERAALRRNDSTALIVAAGGEQRSKVVIEADNIAKSFAGHAVLQPFSTRIMRGDRVGIIGPNGAGKTTLLRMLIGELEPDSGSVKRPAGLEIAIADQRRTILAPDATPWSVLAPEGGDTVMVRGRPVHVMSYLGDFLFEPARARMPVTALSGGERNRLVLARILAKPSDLLVLDEPTNDLDVETLDLLQEALAEFPGTLLLVGHDRDFLDRTVTSTIAFEGEGRAREWPGGYTDYKRQSAAETTAAAPRAKAGAPAEKAATKAEPDRRSGKLTFGEQRELDGLPKRIAKLEAEIATLEAEIADPKLYSRDAKRVNAASTRLGTAREELAEAEDRWLTLEEKREAARK